MAESADRRPMDRAGGKSPTAYRTISEVAEDLDLPQHVLRFWETRFQQIKPLKRGGGRRYYRPEDVEVIRRIRSLLYTEGYTIKGAQRLLRRGGSKDDTAGSRGGKTTKADPTPAQPPAESPPQPSAESPPQPSAESSTQPPAAPMDPDLRAELKTILEELEGIQSVLRDSTV